MESDVARAPLPSTSQLLPRAAVAASACASTVAYALLVWPFFPTRIGTLGHDMSYFVPWLVEGFGAMKAHGFWSPPAFTPAFCGGLPFYGNPQSIPYSLTGLLWWVLEPIAALRASLVVTHLLAFGGMYLCARRVLGVDRASSVLAAVLFSWSTVITDRALAGHWGFLAYAAVPWALLGAGLATRAGATRAAVLVGVACTALSLAYQVEAGFAVAGVPVVLLCVAVVALVVLQGGALVRGALALAASGALAALLAAPKLVPMLAFLGVAPRDQYALPAYESVVLAVRGVIALVFFDAFAIEDASLLIPSMYADAERAHGVGPAGLLAFGGVALAIAGVVRAGRAAWRAPRVLALVVLLAVIASPLALTVQNESLFLLTKKLPVLKSTLSYTRWYLIYAPLVALASAWLIARALTDARARVVCAAAACALTAWHHLSADRSGFQRERYRPDAMLTVDAALRAGQALPPITHVVTPTKTSPIAFMEWNSALADGATALPCYEPLFGYELERMPTQLIAGSVEELVDGRANLADPRCMLYPADNGCAPGDRFRAGDAALGAFARREPIAFAAPWRARVAPAARALGVLVVIVLGVRALREARARRASASVAAA